VTAYDAYRTAQALAEHGLDSDTATRADIDAAADHAGVHRPTDSTDRHNVRIALDAIGGEK
jgi:hypothetical protein